MKIELTLQEKEARMLKAYLQARYNTGSNNIAILVKKYLLEYLGDESIKESDAAVERLNQE